MTLPAPSRTAESADFLALLCADEELLRAEFESIIEANWDEPPRRPAHRPHHTGRPAPRPPRHVRPVRSRRPPGPTWVRQRSPPPVPADGPERAHGTSPRR